MVSCAFLCRGGGTLAEQDGVGDFPANVAGGVSVAHSPIGISFLVSEKSFLLLNCEHWPCFPVLIYDGLTNSIYHFPLGDYRSLLVLGEAMLCSVLICFRQH